MSPQDYAAIVATAVMVLSGVTAMIHFIVKHYLSELKNNGGSSMRDAIDRLEVHSEKLETRIDRIFELLTDRSQ